jgi:cephalosporin hydroxylase
MEFEDKIYKKCNLEHNDSISTYNGWAAQQNYNAFEVFHNFIRDVRPSKILEVGTSNGGFTQFLNYTCKRLGLDTHIISLDIHEKSWYNDLRDSGIDLRIKNVFHDQYQDIDDEYKEFIQSEGTCIVLCDGGDKMREFNLLSKFLKTGDFILGHDYAYDRDMFLNDINLKVWNWHELSESDISEACETNNLIDYNRDIFQSVVWVCKIKN